MAVAPAWEMDSLGIGTPSFAPPAAAPSLKGRYRVEPDTFGAMAANTEGVVCSRPKLDREPAQRVLSFPGLV